MVEQEEKRWLRALLEGEVEPGSEEWEQVCTDSAFTRVREKVGAVARLDFTQQEDEVEGMWRVLLDRRKKGLERRARGRKRLLRWISGTAAVVALGIGGWLSIRGVEREQVVVVGGRTVEGRTELVLPNGERRVLGDDKVRVVSDSCGEMRTENRTLIVELGGQETKKAEYYTLNVPYGEKYSIVLPDGTKVFLNAGTTLRYPDHFEGGSREVYLNGEAYLEVTKDAEHPFVVKTEEVEVKVLGTVFNVNAYPEGEWVRTTLVEGKVEAVCGGRLFVMEPGMQVAYSKGTGETEYKKVDTHLFTSWKDGYYEFEEMELGELMPLLGRWYAVGVDFEEPELKRLKFSGRLQRYETVADLVKMLEYTGDVVFEVKNDRILVRKREKKKQAVDLINPLPAGVQDTSGNPCKKRRYSILI